MIKSYPMAFGAMPCVVLNQIKSIADQCPDDGGFAVFAARAWYRRFEPMARWEGRANCFEARPVAAASAVGRPLVLRVSPNPATDRLQVVLETAWRGRFLLFSATGTKVAEWALSGTSNSLDVSTLPSGLYFYRFQDPSGLVQGGKVTLIR